jgi:hypothetical protein
MDYSIIDATGELRIVLTAAAPIVDEDGTHYPELIALNTPPGCTFMEGAPPFGAGWWDGTTWHERPAPPNSWASWDTVAKAWVDRRTLDEAKAQQWGAVSAGRDATIFGTLTWSGSVFQIDTDSQQRIQGAVMLAQLAQAAGQNAWTIDWTLADNSVRTLSIADMIAVGMALGAFMQVNWNKATALRAQIEAAQTPDQFAAIVWTPA